MSYIDRVIIPNELYRCYFNKQITNNYIANHFITTYTAKITTPKVAFNEAGIYSLYSTFLIAQKPIKEAYFAYHFYNTVSYSPFEANKRTRIFKALIEGFLV